MSTVKSNIQAQRFVLLSRLDEQIFHTNDLALLWGINKKNTLHTTLKRYVQAGLLFRIYRGLYSLKPLTQIDPVLLGSKALHQYCYVTTETVLFREGYISQKTAAITYASLQSKRFTIGSHHFRTRRLAPQFLMNSLGILHEDGVRLATPERAIADMLYFNAQFHFDKKVDWKKIQQLQQEIGYPLTKTRYDSPAA